MPLPSRRLQSRLAGVGTYHNLSGRVWSGRFEGHMRGRVAGESSRSSGIFEPPSPHYARITCCERRQSVEGICIGAQDDYAGANKTSWRSPR